jgi:hypothetical protein
VGDDEAFRTGWEALRRVLRGRDRRFDYRLAPRPPGHETGDVVERRPCGLPHVIEVEGANGESGESEAPA